MELNLTTAYHSAANRQSERNVQTVKIALRCMVAEGRASTGWDDWLPEIQFTLNTSTNIATGETLFQLLYGVPPRLEFVGKSAKDTPAAEQFIADRLDIRAKARDAL